MKVWTDYIKCSGDRLYVGKILSSGGRVADCRCPENTRLTLLTVAVLELLEK
jgi:hypothetical protein